MKSKFFSLIIVLSLIVFLFVRAQKKEETNYVPNEETAIRIAEAIWLPIYGDRIYSEKPFVATFKKKTNTWIVEGSLPPNSSGGVALIEIRKSDCKILRVKHGK